MLSEKAIYYLCNFNRLFSYSCGHGSMLACLPNLPESLGLTASIKKLKEGGGQRGGERERKGLKGEEGDRKRERRLP